MSYRIVFLVSFIFIWACESSGSLRKADSAFDLKKYYTALEIYKSEFNKTEDTKLQALYAYRIGICYKKNADFSQSLKWFKKAYDLDYGPPALEQYAFSLKQNEEYEAAMKAFQQLADESNSSQVFKREINICKLCIQWKKKQSPYQFKLTSEQVINSAEADYAGFKHSDGVFYFISDREQAKNNYEWTGRSFHDIWSIDSTISSEPIKLPQPLNSNSHEGPFCFDSLSQRIFFTRCDKSNTGDHFCHLYVSFRTTDAWSQPEYLNINLPSANTTHPALSPSNKMLVFSSDRQGGFGKYDLYYSMLGPDGEWSDALAMPEEINTAGSELFPVFNGDTLFFSSDYIAGMGGLDIFKTFLLPDSSWASPQHLPYPVNSGSDDLFFKRDPFFIPNDSVRQRAWFTSNRNTNKKDDIFLAEEILTKTSIKQKEKNPPLANFNVYVEFSFVESDAYKRGLPANQSIDSVLIYPETDAQPILAGRKIKLQILEGQDYSFKFSKRNYLNANLNFTSATRPVDLKLDSQFIHNFVIELTPLRFNEEFVLKDVYYDFDKSDIRADAIPALDRLADLLLANPRINVRLASHTDCRGEDQYNLSLSLRRAQAAISYLQSQGISSKRLFAEAKGELDPSVPCLCEYCTEEEHQLNRRTTFTLLRQ